MMGGWGMYESSAQLALPGHITPELPMDGRLRDGNMLLFKFNGGGVGGCMRAQRQLALPGHITPELARINFNSLVICCLGGGGGMYDELMLSLPSLVTSLLRLVKDKF